MRRARVGLRQARAGQRTFTGLDGAAGLRPAYRRRRAMVVSAVTLTLAVIAATVVAGCSPGGSTQATPDAAPPGQIASPSQGGPGQGGPGPGGPGPGGPGEGAPGGAEAFTFTISPKPGTKNVPISTEVGIALTGATIVAVTLTKAGSRPTVKGALRGDATSWVPSAPLAFSTGYNATVTARRRDTGATETRTTSFTTMGATGRHTGTGLYLFDGQSVGVAMPVVIEFNPPVPASARAGVQRRLFVTSDPPQPGVWHWASGSQVWYRPPTYWRPGTTITVRAALRGHPTGNGNYGDSDRSATATVAPKLLMDVDNRTKKMSVYLNDVLLRTIPVSLGKPSTPSSSGHLVVMSKDYKTVFDTRNEGPDGYRVDISYAMRVTWGGEFIHAAPWSVGDQGRRNVSHGCVNMSWGNAEWLFGQAHIGDPVIVRNTEVPIAPGNGWTAWDLSWERYIKGSALPVPADLANAQSTQPQPARSPVR